MYLKVRKIGSKAKEDDLIIEVSKITRIVELRKSIAEQLDVAPEKQILLYKGKQLVDEHRVVDYDIRLNDVVQLMIRTQPKKEESTKEDEGTKPKCDTKEFRETEEKEDTNSQKREVKCESKYYKIGDYIDYIDYEYGSWNEGVIVDIVTLRNKELTDEKVEESEIIFKVKTDRRSPYEAVCLNFDDIRPRARRILKKEDLNIGDVVFVNYNIEKPSSRGYWYDFIVENLENGIKGTILEGRDKRPVEDCSIKYFCDIMKIELPTLVEERTDDSRNVPVKRNTAYRCNKCKDIQTRKCKDCGCKVCFGKENPKTMVVCDDCDGCYHISCLDPPLTEIPTDPEWYCPSCKTDENEIVKAGDKLKFSSKKAKMASNKEAAGARDWGRGMACVGRTKECTIVPKDHYGPVPGVEVGTCWKFRVQASEAGIHRPHVAGIHGRETDGAYSLVLSGGYEDDIDNGEEFYYTGSGGRDLSGNKRISVQSRDQTLTKMNKALALNCNAKFDAKDGATAEDWKGGKPVRVVRNYKLGKHSKYAPKDGNRYDGIYKVVKYFPEKGKSGHLVWRYLLRRDDPTPPPWHKKGKELDMLYPDGYLEVAAQKEKEDVTKKGKKRNALGDSFSSSPTKKLKVSPHKLDKVMEKLIKGDSSNEKLWVQCKEVLKEGKVKFLEKVEEVFRCICCFEVVYQPVTTPCKHNVCKSCLKRSFSAEIYTCPLCRFELGEKFKLEVNEKLNEILLLLFPGYENGR